MNEDLKSLIANVEKVIIGKNDPVKLLIVGLLTNGHVLFEDVPGTGKTTLALALAKSISGDFKRIQFTPDLLPSDVTGGAIYNAKMGEFEIRKGPVFANILLADEINRTTPRTQSALLEAMQEFRVTLDGKTYDLPQPFMVIATQNPIEHMGTYPLPEAQVDRFLLKASMGYPSVADEIKIMTGQKFVHPVDSLKPVMDLNKVIALQQAVKKIEVTQEILDYIARLVFHTRENKEEIRLGASPRASLCLMRSASAWALLEGRDYVVPDDVVAMAPFILRHRIMLQPKVLVSGRTVDDVVMETIKKVPIS